MKRTLTAMTFAGVLMLGSVFGPSRAVAHGGEDSSAHPSAHHTDVHHHAHANGHGREKDGHQKVHSNDHPSVHDSDHQQGAHH